MDGKRETHLSPVSRRRSASADREARQTSRAHEGAAPKAVRPNQRWSMDFVSDRLADGRWFRILTVLDQYTRECLCAYADRSQTGEKVVEQMKRLMTCAACRSRLPPITAANSQAKRWMYGRIRLE